MRKVASAAKRQHPHLDTYEMESKRAHSQMLTCMLFRKKFNGSRRRRRRKARGKKEQCLNDTALNGIVRADEVAKQALVDESDMLFDSIDQLKSGRIKERRKHRIHWTETCCMVSVVISHRRFSLGLIEIEWVKRTDGCERNSKNRIRNRKKRWQNPRQD